MAPKIGTLAHAQDPAWLIALWLAIHGGDPAPIEGVVSQEIQEGAALRAIAALSEALDQTSRDAVKHAIAPAQKQRQIELDCELFGGRYEVLPTCLVHLCVCRVYDGAV